LTHSYPMSMAPPVSRETESENVKPRAPHILLGLLLAGLVLIASLGTRETGRRSSGLAGISWPAGVRKVNMTPAPVAIEKLRSCTSPWWSLHYADLGMMPMRQAALAARMRHCRGRLTRRLGRRAATDLATRRTPHTPAPRRPRLAALAGRSWIVGSGWPDPTIHDNQHHPDRRDRHEIRPQREIQLPPVSGTSRDRQQPACGWARDGDMGGRAAARRRTRRGSPAVCAAPARPGRVHVPFPRRPGTSTRV
jgi:hypothetical protein